jgi:hypothetical protein
VRLGHALQAGRGVGATAPADGKLGEQQRHHDERQSREIEEDERGAAIGADFVGEFPDAAQAHGGADGRENESRLSRPAFGARAHGEQRCCGSAVPLL